VYCNVKGDGERWGEGGMGRGGDGERGRWRIKLNFVYLIVSLLKIIV
jgi:hypothetical protein